MDKRIREIRAKRVEPFWVDMFAQSADMLDRQIQTPLDVFVYPLSYHNSESSSQLSLPSTEPPLLSQQPVLLFSSHETKMSAVTTTSVEKDTTELTQPPTSEIHSNVKTKNDHQDDGDDDEDDDNGDDDDDDDDDDEQKQTDKKEEENKISTDSVSTVNVNTSSNSSSSSPSLSFKSKKQSFPKVKRLDGRKNYHVWSTAQKAMLKKWQANCKIQSNLQRKCQRWYWRWFVVASFLAASSAILSGSSLFLEEKYTRLSGYCAAILIIVIPSLGWERKSDRHVKTAREYDRIALEICTAIRSETQNESFSSFEHRYGARMQDLVMDPEVDPPTLITNRSMELVYDILNDEVELAKRVPANSRRVSKNFFDPSLDDTRLEQAVTIDIWKEQG